MALNIKLIRRFEKTRTEDVLHNSAYASIQNSGGFGATSAESFHERREIDQNRQVVQGYQRAQVAQQVNKYARAKTMREEAAENAARKAALRAKYSRDKNEREKRKQEFNAHQESGGLSEAQIGRIQSAYATGAAARQQMTAREITAKRFEAPARPIPKTGGFGKY